MDTETSEFLDLFLQEAEDLLRPLATHLRHLKTDADDPEALEYLHRLAHTLKTDSGMVGLMAMKGFCRVLEQTVASVRSGDRRPDESFVRRVTEEFRFLRNSVESLRNDRDVDIQSFEQRKESLEAFFQDAD